MYKPTYADKIKQKKAINNQTIRKTVLIVFFPNQCLLMKAFNILFLETYYFI